MDEAGQHGGARAERVDEGVLVVLRGVNTNPGENPEDMVSIRIWIDAHRVISARRRQLLSIVDLAQALEAGT